MTTSNKNSAINSLNAPKRAWAESVPEAWLEGRSLSQGLAPGPFDTQISMNSRFNSRCGVTNASRVSEVLSYRHPWQRHCRLHHQASQIVQKTTVRAAAGAAEGHAIAHKQEAAADKSAASAEVVQPPTTTTATLLLSCEDQKGVIAAVAQLLFGFNCNITSSDQFTDGQANMFFQRVVFDYKDCIVGLPNIAVLERAIGDLAKRFNMNWTISYKNQVKRAAILVSKQDHCLWDLLIRMKGQELETDNQHSSLIPPSF
jgi:hypothetical protein